MKKLYFLITSIFMLLFVEAKTQNIHHWETAVFDNDIWKYFVGTSEPDTNWRKVSFNDGSWQQGVGGVGYGDGDDNTIISNTLSLYTRRIFTVTDTSKIELAVLNMDYDDGFVAYLNDVEIGRANIGSFGDHPLFNQGSSGLHEAQMYQAGSPEQYIINTQLLKSILIQGNNVLTIQVHNDNISSSDLTSRAFLSFGLNDASSQFSANPTWFQPPLVFTSSNLPIVSINTNSQTINDNVRIVADMGIIYNGPGNRNYMVDPFNEYNGKISIELRGSSSQSFPKKSYSLETQDSLGNNNNVAIMDMPKENDWVLYAPYSDKTLIRNVLTYRLGEKLGGYAPRTKLCELVLNGDYKGVYVFTEKIKKDNDRVDIATLDSTDLSGDDLTGGYIVKIDKTTNGPGIDWSSPIPPPNTTAQQINYQFHYPKQDEILPVQGTYIENYITSFENALDGPNFTDTTLGYRPYIDELSFIDFFIMNELSRNVDGFRLSTFLYKDKDSKGGEITMGPLWDFNLSFGNANYCDGGLSTGWSSDFNYVCPGDGFSVPFWWDRLKQDTTYTNQLRCRWENLRLKELHQDTILSFIDTLASYLSESQQRNFQRWPILTSYVWPNNFIGNTYANEITYLKNWVTNRISWIDNNIPGNCYNVGIEENFATLSFNVFPNPASDYIYLNLNGKSGIEKQIHIINSIGSVVYQSQTNAKRHSVNVSGLARGIYIVEVVEDNLRMYKKIIIN